MTDTTKKPRDNRKPMASVRANKRARGLRPVEMWVHESRTDEQIVELRRQLQLPVNERPSISA